MSNLYPQLMANGNGNGGGSFDDYDSIIDEFSIGCENSDISSMHMSDMAEIIIAGVAAANTAETIATTTTIPHDALPKGGEAIMPPPKPDADANDDHHNPDINDNHNDHGANNGYYYHVGDLYHVDSLGIDNTDMSAILGLASVSSSSAASATTTSIGPSSSVDAGSLLPIRNTTRNHNGIEMEEDDQHSLPSVYAIKNDVAMRMTNNNSMQDEMTPHNDDDEEDGMNQSICVSKQLGPLGDELSYAENSVEYQHYGIYEPSNSDYAADYAADYATDYLDEEEDDVTNHHRSILPNLITYSSRRSKCVTVFSTAFILGILVFAMVAVGVSYSSTGSINPFTSSTTTINGNLITGGIGGDGVEDGNNISGSIDSIRLPLESDDEEKDATNNNSSKQTTTTTTSRPTSSLTMSGTSTAEVDSFTALPTTSPRDDELDEKPIQQQQQQQQVMTLVPTTMPSELPSLLRRPSTTPTLSSNPTTQPSMSNVPSLVPTISSQPSWPVGNDSVMEGDARFYLMADGGGNLRFADRLESFPMGQHKFMVHLGSAIRVVDDCDPNAYARTEAALSNSPIPVYSLPGDNDYPKCTNPTAGWMNYQQYMMNINTKYWDIPQEYDVKRQASRMENFSFLYRRVLFLGLNTVSNIEDEWETAFRVQENIDWVRETVEAYWDNADAIFVMGYGRLVADESEPFYDAMVSLTKKPGWADRLLVYARRSSELDIDRSVGGNKNFIELKVGSEWSILDVRVRTKMDGTPKLNFEVVGDSENV